MLLRYAFPGAPPRFLFALGSNSMLLRSPDRGATWKTVFSPHPTPTDAHDRNDTKENGGVALGDIMAVLQGRNEAGVDVRDENVLWVVCQGETVVFGGKKGIIGLSGNRGLSFTLHEDEFASLVGKAAKLSYAALLDSTHLVVTCEEKVILAELLPGEDSGSPWTLSAPKLLLTCKQNVCLLQVHGRGTQCEIIVAEPSLLHYSPDSGSHFVELEHSFGFIRGIDFLSSTRNTHLPRFPSEARVLQGEKVTKTKRADSSSDPVSYEYAVGVKKSLDLATLRGVMSGVERSFLTVDHGGNTAYRYLFICGVGTEVLPYDYSAMLCICLRASGEELCAYTIGSRVSYVPYTRSGPGEALLCATSTVPESDKTTFIRGNSSGVAFSGDGVKWSDPKRSSPVSIIPCDGGDVIVCGQRNTITTFSCNATATWPIPSELRIPSLINVAYLQ
ncbi:hypothetical protein STCU_00650 [Strigomonas culicis]|uniref:Uncharacterized protein n=1 Tax=Strigomonas culicis TaxID=28005 RepID=S9V5F3_9TRYP|nr:hypothetical protein STCU_00650 [Strigomonas culicis]|eukprot:EPY36309.1 hypothetical protein STCU_00650 [Strigomonas culicis]